MKLTLRIWRQKDAKSAGKLESYTTPDFSSHASFLEMLDILNEQLISDGKDPVAFDHDCREGICGACSLVINGIPHGPMAKTTVCQLHMRFFKDGDTVTILSAIAGGNGAPRNMTRGPANHAAKRSLIRQATRTWGFLANAVILTEPTRDGAVE